MPGHPGHPEAGGGHAGEVMGTGRDMLAVLRAMPPRLLPSGSSQLPTLGSWCRGPGGCVPPRPGRGCPRPGEGKRGPAARSPLDRAPSSALLCSCGGGPSALPPCLSPCMFLVPLQCPSCTSQPQPGKHRSRGEELSGAPPGSWLIIPCSVACSCCSRTNTALLSYLQYSHNLH